MLIIIQFPICDIRPFLNEDTGQLQIPCWPIGSPDKDFMRSIGPLKYRKNGGLSGWLGENIICIADNAIKFRNIYSFINPNTKKFFRPKIKFRRFYFDGQVVGKFEIGVEILENDSFSPFLNDIIHYVLDLPILIVNPSGKDKKNRLYNIGSQLAKLYLWSSTETKYLNRGVEKQFWVQSLKPLIIIRKSQSKINIDANKLQNTDLNQELIDVQDNSVEINYNLFSHKGLDYPTWIIEEPENRSLRLYLSRLHAEKECLKHVISCLAVSKIEISPFSRKSDEFQNYINTASRRILSLNKKSTSSVGENIEDYAKKIIDLKAPGEKEAIIDALQKLKIRKNIFNKIVSFYEQNDVQSENLFSLNGQINLDTKNEIDNLGQVLSIQDKKLQENIIRALKNLTIENVDLGLFDLGKLLEQELKRYLLLAKGIDQIQVSNNDMRNVSNMIDCVVRNNIFPEKYELHFLRQERNKRAHDEIPDLTERTKLLRYAPFLSDLYISYISELRGKSENLSL